MSAQPVSRVQLFAAPWIASHQAPLSLGFPRQGYWSGLPFPSPGDLPDPGIQPGSPAVQADSLLIKLQRKPTLLVNSLLKNASVFKNCAGFTKEGKSGG